LTVIEREDHRVIPNEIWWNSERRSTVVRNRIDALEDFRKQLEGADVDLLREMVKVFAEQLMGADADALCGADYGERSPERVNRRNGYRERAWDTRAGTIALQARRPIPEFGDITYSFNGGKSRYHAFQSKFDWRLRAGINILSSLTLSQTKDNGSGSLENPNGNFPAPQDFRNLEAEYGLSAYHQPYNSTTSFIIELPFGKGRRWADDVPVGLDAVIGGWQIAGINTIIPGEMVTLIYMPAAAFQVSGIQQDFRGANNYRPNVIGDVLAPKGERNVQNWFNRNNVVIPTDPSQPFGNAPRNSVRGPKIWQVDFVATKKFALPWRPDALEFRAEFFNLLNRTNFRAPNGNRSSAGFGTITATYDPRIIQFGLKLNF